MSGQTDHQTYYVPEQSRMAICASVSLFLTVFGAATAINGNHPQWGSETLTSVGWYIFAGGLAMFVATLTAWFGLTIKENRAGMNSAQLKRSYRIGMQWFIFSEVMFFFTFFGALFYVRTLVGPWLEGQGAGSMNGLLWEGFTHTWPVTQTPQEAVGGAGSQLIANNGTFTAPYGEMHWSGVPLINTILLVSSSVTLHFAHHALLEDKRKPFNMWLLATLVLGFVFVGFQAYEYYHAYNDLGLTLESGIYGSTFFLLTGFHGLHVCMGAVMLTVQWLRSVRSNHFTKDDHFGFEASAWYWHFVDVVWIGLFFFVYIL